MKEGKIIIIIFLILFSLGSISSAFYIFSSDFNFYRSELKINENKVNEELFFYTDKDYHTLYRNFVTPIRSNLDYGKYPNAIVIDNVVCSEGNGYFRNFNGKCENYNSNSEECLAYTENNEYGCTFGNFYGFKADREYRIIADYKIENQNLFKINDKNYIKFVVYSENQHKYLNNKNFIIDGEVIKKERYFPNEQVIVYIQYVGDTKNYYIINYADFVFDNGLFWILFISLLSISPAFLVVIVWYLSGKEISDADFPSQISYHPEGRKGWEVAAFFNPLFGLIDRNFFSTIILDLYHRKILDLMPEKRKVLIKITGREDYLDNIEKKFLGILKGIIKRAPEKCFKNGYLDLQKAITLPFSESSFYGRKEFRDFQKHIKKLSKKYIDTKGDIIMTVFIYIMLFFMQFIFVFIRSPIMIIIIFVLIFGFFIIKLKTTLFIRYKGSYYKEYLHWRAFKNYLNGSFTIREGTHRTVVIWDKYLVYATALGVSKKVIKELAKHHMITEEQRVVYIGVYYSSGSFASSSGTGGGGGIGGAGGGGAGGGGGGGR